MSDMVLRQTKDGKAIEEHVEDANKEEHVEDGFIGKIDRILNDRRVRLGMDVLTFVSNLLDIAYVSTNYYFFFSG